VLADGEPRRRQTHALRVQSPTFDPEWANAIFSSSLDRRSFSSLNASRMRSW